MVHSFKKLFIRPIRRLLKKKKPFHGSAQYWENRYQAGGNSGDGSYRLLAEFKAELINGFVREHSVKKVTEFGVGDGNQLALAEYPEYLGVDVSEKAIASCQKKFSGDPSKNFILLKNFAGQQADLTLSLDVIYHLIEDKVFEDHMTSLFSSSKQYCIIYASNTNETIGKKADHVKHRRFTDWVDKHFPDWTLLKQVPNKYPWNGDTKTGSFADFFIYEKLS